MTESAVSWSLKHFPGLIKDIKDCLACRLLYACAFEVHEYGKNQDFQKLTYRCIAQGSLMTRKVYQGKGHIYPIFLVGGPNVLVFTQFFYKQLSC